MLQNVKIGCLLGWLGSPKVIGNVTIQYSAYDFLFVFINKNYIYLVPFSRYRYGELFVEIRQLRPTHQHFGPRWR